MILKEIIKNKIQEIDVLKRKISLEDLKKQAKRLSVRSCFFRALKKPGLAVIAEIKQKSPSRGILRKNFEPITIAKEYQKAGARALSVLTDKKFFGGSSEILKEVRANVSLPILRKDFIVDEYQLWESKVMGCDAVLLIAGILTPLELKSYSRIARCLGLDILFEVHSEKDIRKILPLNPRIVGINNRDLKTFKVDIRTTEKLKKFLPKDTFVISESGIQNHSDLVYLKNCGVSAFLVGESLMKQKSPGSALRALLRS